nr:glycoside hydrolase family 16 protein [Kineococcus vitellinus]
MPSGTLAGWQQVWAEDFTRDAPTGSFRAAYPSIGDYGDGSPDTSRNGCYNNGANVSAHDGMADIHLRTVDGCPSGGVLVANNWKAQTYGRYSIRYRADAATGYGAAFLLWPASDNWTEGEIDFPESSFTQKQYMAVFQPGAPGVVAYKNSTNASWQDWHTATMEWTPGLIVFLIDGAEVGRTTKGVPTTPFKWILQAATDGASKPAPSVQGHLLIDWMTYSRRA